MLALVTPLAATDESRNFLVSPNVGLMIWTLLAFVVTLFVLRKAAFPRISEALDKRQRAIEESIDSAERARTEAEELLAEYRERLKEAREQAEEIVARARKAGEGRERESLERPAAARGAHGADPARHRGRDAARDPGDPQRGRRPHGPGDREGHAQDARRGRQRRLVEEALGELDFAQLCGGERRN